MYIHPRYLTYPWLDTPDFQIFDANGVVVQQIASFVDEALTNGEAVRARATRVTRVETDERASILASITSLRDASRELSRKPRIPSPLAPIYPRSRSLHSPSRRSFATRSRGRRVVPCA